MRLAADVSAAVAWQPPTSVPCRSPAGSSEHIHQAGIPDDTLQAYAVVILDEA